MNPRTILGVSNDATEEEIKAAYRTLAKKHHPDLNKDDASATAKFAEINEAYEMLTKKPSNNYRPENQYDGFTFNFDGVDINIDQDVIREYFRQRSRNATRQYNVSANITLEDAHNGGVLNFDHNGQTINLEIPAGINERTRIQTKVDDKTIVNFNFNIVATGDFNFDMSGRLIKNIKMSATDFNNLNSIEVENHVNKKYTVHLKKNISTQSLLRIAGAGLYDKDMNTTKDLYLIFTVYRDKD